MKRTVVTTIAVVLALMMVYGLSTTGKVEAAAVGGVCSNCHTMHNSQNGTTPTGGTANPNAYLTLNTCTGCHADTSRPTANIFNSGTTGAGGTLIASGTFSAAIATSDSRKHNPVYIENGAGATTGITADATLTATAPGGTMATNVLSCAGTNGCHGTSTGIAGNHHNASAGYRFLYVDDSTAVLGKGPVDGSNNQTRELGGATTTSHNVYSSSTTAGINKYCAKCHGSFHGTANTGSGSPFTRHPTDNTIGSNGTAGWIASYAQDADYHNTPVAFANITTISTSAAYDAATLANAQVACVSCHRAHGSNQPDLLRFDYAAQSAGGGDVSGCLTCHVRQR